MSHSNPHDDIVLTKKEATKAICEEMPVEFIVNDKKIVTFMATPQNLNELAVGYLYSRGLISEVDDILVLGTCNDMTKVTARTRTELAQEQYGLAGVLTSGCGSGAAVSAAFLKREKIDSNLQITLYQLKALTKKMFSEATLYRETGGIHCAAIANNFCLVTCREDVGRHNAIDKVIGKGLFQGIDFSQHVILTTGRLSSDMILKAVAGKIPIVVSRSIPTSLAIEIAEEIGITVVGRIASFNPIVYTHDWRIIQ
ncbi:MAG: formate dehydrogenase accessory sulfurtransferase FdhD [Bacillota bacterium]|nr:formate dehydrogenase accessory sulfurtransferase FdhD [Bacillota bacterium]